jgi:flagellar biosynthesis component FlhA
MDLCSQVASAWKAAMEKGLEKPVMLCDSRLRAALANLLSRSIPSLSVVAYDEITLGTEIESLQTISCGNSVEVNQKYLQKV